MENLIKHMEEFRNKNLPLWQGLLNELFPPGLPTSCEWRRPADIINVLNKLGLNVKNEFNGIDYVTHTFLPMGGGLDLQGAAFSSEPNCIELTWHETNASIVKPVVLSFESFEGPYEWAYFRLDCGLLKPSGVYDSGGNIYEEVTEMGEGEYVERSAWDEGYNGYDEAGREIPLPENARVITRHFSGSFVIFAKGSTYNLINETYDGRHSTMSREIFRSYIEKAVDQFSKE